MHLSAKEIDKLILHGAGFLAQKRYARGLRLNYIETVALLSAQVLEFIRDGNSVAELMEKGKRILGLSDVMSGVANMLDEVQVEGTFADGTKLVTIHQPVCLEAGESNLALHGSGLVRTSLPAALPILDEIVPGEIMPLPGTIEINQGRLAIVLEVTNTGDRPIQVGSHYPFFETNKALRFDRRKAFNYRLDIAAGTAVRFEPGETKRVSLVMLAGSKTVIGGNGLINGPASPERLESALNDAVEAGFSHQEAK